MPFNTAPIACSDAHRSQNYVPDNLPLENPALPLQPPVDLFDGAKSAEPPMSSGSFAANASITLPDATRVDMPLGGPKGWL